MATVMILSHEAESPLTTRDHHATSRATNKHCLLHREIYWTESDLNPVWGSARTSVQNVDCGQTDRHCLHFKNSLMRFVQRPLEKVPNSWVVSYTLVNKTRYIDCERIRVQVWKWLFMNGARRCWVVVTKYSWCWRPNEHLEWRYLALFVVRTIWLFL
jgi:hypothetical protein